MHQFPVQGQSPLTQTSSEPPLTSSVPSSASPSLSSSSYSASSSATPVAPISPRSRHQNLLPLRHLRQSLRLRPPPIPIPLLHHCPPNRITLDTQQKRVCVAKCPSASDTTLQCMPTDNISCSFNNDKNFHVGYYPNAPETSTTPTIQHSSAASASLLTNQPEKHSTLPSTSQTASSSSTPSPPLASAPLSPSPLESSTQSQSKTHQN